MPTTGHQIAALQGINTPAPDRTSDRPIAEQANDQLSLSTNDTGQRADLGAYRAQPIALVRMIILRGLRDHAERMAGRTYWRIRSGPYPLNTVTLRDCLGRLRAVRDGRQRADSSGRQHDCPERARGSHFAGAMVNQHPADQLSCGCNGGSAVNHMPPDAVTTVSAGGARSREVVVMERGSYARPGDVPHPVPGALTTEVGAFTSGREVHLSAISPDIRPSPATISVAIADSLVETSVDRQGHGFQRALLISSLKLLGNRGAADNDASIILLAIEEPELAPGAPRGRHPGPGGRGGRDERAGHVRAMEAVGRWAAPLADRGPSRGDPGGVRDHPGAPRGGRIARAIGPSHGWRLGPPGTRHRAMPDPGHCIASTWYSVTPGGGGGDASNTCRFCGAPSAGSPVRSRPQQPHAVGPHSTVSSG